MLSFPISPPAICTLQDGHIQSLSPSPVRLVEQLPPQPQQQPHEQTRQHVHTSFPAPDNPMCSTIPARTPRSHVSTAYSPSTLQHSNGRADRAPVPRSTLQHILRSSCAPLLHASESNTLSCLLHQKHSSNSSSTVTSFIISPRPGIRPGAYG